MLSVESSKTRWPCDLSCRGASSNYSINIHTSDTTIDGRLTPSMAKGLTGGNQPSRS
jgi:hypothetical protein